MFKPFPWMFITCFSISFAIKNISEERLASSSLRPWGCNPGPFLTHFRSFFPSNKIRLFFVKEIYASFKGQYITYSVGMYSWWENWSRPKRYHIYNSMCIVQCRVMHFVYFLSSLVSYSVFTFFSPILEYNIMVGTIRNTSILCYT